MIKTLSKGKENRIGKENPGQLSLIRSCALDPLLHPWCTRKVVRKRNDENDIGELRNWMPGHD